MLTRTTAIAVEALIYMHLAPRDIPFSPREIAKALDESPTYMQKITHRLVEAGILEARRGARGGVSFGRPADKVTLLDCMNACQEGPAHFHCAIGDKTSERCGVARVLERLDREVTRYLSNVTVAELATEPCPLQGSAMSELCMFASAHNAICSNCARRPEQNIS